MSVMDITTTSAPAALPATPVRHLQPPPHPREDGWSVGVQRAFIEALAECGSVAAAARAVGMHPSSAYRLRAAPHGLGFRGAWNAALAMAYTRLHEVAFDRAVNGVEQPVYQRGELVGTRVVHNDRLLMFLLDHVSRSVPDRDRLIGAAADDRMPDHFAAAVAALETPPAPLRHRSARPARAARRAAQPCLAPTPAPVAAPTPAPSPRFDPDRWNRHSGVDLVSTSAPQALEPGHGL